MAQGRNYAGPPLISVDIPAIELKTALRNLDNVHGAVLQRVVDWTIGAGTDVLKASLPLVPWDTGKLRKSGKVFIDTNRGSWEIAHGLKRSDKIYYTSDINRFTPQLSRTWAKRGLKFIQARIQYSRVSDSAEGPRDIAIWTHENLNPHGSGTPPSARKPGTGPKYLENAYNHMVPKWRGKLPAVEQQINRDQRIMSSIQTINLKGNIFQRLTMKLGRLKKFIFFRR